MTVEILVGDARKLLRAMPAASVNCVVTSPPYWVKRDYGVDGQFGLEPTVSGYVRSLVKLFREIRRVLRDDGVVWLNLGDTYASSGGPGVGTGDNGIRRGRSHQQRGVRHGTAPRTAARGGIKAKDLVGIPWRVALALQADGWWLRQDIIWAKPNPMPESILDRCTTAHEYVFMLAKSGRPTIWRARDTGEWSGAPDHSERVPNPSQNPAAVARRPFVNRWVGMDYYFDKEAIAEPVDGDTLARYERGRSPGAGADRPGAQTIAKSFAHMAAPVPAGWNRGDGSHGSYHPEGREAAAGVAPVAPDAAATRNKRSVWTVSTEPFTGKHFATFPTRLVAPMIAASTSEKGRCSACGSPWCRTVERGEPLEAWRRASGADASGGYSGVSRKDHTAAGVQDASDVKRRILEGMRAKHSTWHPSCNCGAPPEPCVVLDPFGGAGTTALAAQAMGRSCILIELNPKYAAMARRRLKAARPVLAVSGADEPPPEEDLPLWANL